MLRSFLKPRVGRPPLPTPLGRWRGPDRSYSMLVAPTTGFPKSLRFPQLHHFEHLCGRTIKRNQNPNAFHYVMKRYYFKSKVYYSSKSGDVDPVTESQILYDQGNVEFEKGNIFAAEKLLNKAIKVNPDHLEAHFKLAVLLKEQKKINPAINRLKKILALNITDEIRGRIYKSIGSIQHEEHQYTAALRSYQTALNYIPDDKMVHSNMALCLFVGLQKVSESVEHWRKVVEIDPKDVTGWVGLGRVLRELEEDVEALNCFESAIGIDSSCVDALVNLGIYHSEKRNLEEAEKLLRKAIHIQPKNSEAHMNLGIVLEDQGNIEEAFKHLESAQELEPKDSQSFMVSALIYHKLGEIEKAIKCYRKVIALHPDNPEAFVNLGLILQEQNKISEALDYYKKAHRLEPKNTNYLNVLGTGHRLLGESNEARVCYTEALKIDYDDWNAHLNLAMLYYETGIEDLATKHRETAIKINPECREMFQNIDEYREQLSK